MRILQVSPRYYPTIGGIEEHVRNIGERLAREHEVTVFACDPWGNCRKRKVQMASSSRGLRASVHPMLIISPSEWLGG